MNTRAVRSTLVKAFNALTKRQRDRLRWHREQGTEVLMNRHTFIDSAGHG